MPTFWLNVNFDMRNASPIKKSEMRDSNKDIQKRIDQLKFDYRAQPKQAVTRCNLCGHPYFIVISQSDRYGFPAHAHGCLRCGLVFLNPVMTKEAYKDFYTNTYRPLVSAYHGRRIDAETIQEDQIIYAEEQANILEEYLSSKEFTSLLDIGGSTGVVAHYFAQRFGLHATILDPSQVELEKAKGLGLETTAGLLEDFDPGEKRFDLVLLCQTVDHLLDVSGAMNKVRALMEANGLFFLDIVDFRAAYLRNWSVEKSIKIDHPFYLTEDTMRAYLLRAGFDVLRMVYAADHLHIGYVCRIGKPIPDYLPEKRAVKNFWREVRMVQNAPRIL